MRRAMKLRRRLLLASLLALACARAFADDPPRATLTLKTVADVPLPGRPVRFDYMAVDPAAHRLYVAHMNDDHLVVFDTENRRVVGHLEGFKNVHGVIVVPALGKVLATATKDRDVVVLNAADLKVRARLGPIGYGDGLAYAPDEKKVFVSDESDAGRELVLDAENDRVLGTVELGGEAGNTQWDPTSHRVLVAVQTKQEVVAIDPRTNAIAERHPIEGAEHPHGLCVNVAANKLYVADEGTSEVIVVDLATWRVAERHRVSECPDVMAFDPGPRRLYVACEGGALHAFTAAEDGALTPAAELHVPHAHTVAVDPTTHLVYLPLQDVGGKPVLRILSPE